ncbi:uncharacterized protein LOC129283150 isoform X2 [Lytechinus pictus]|uniref:uncharacterized protein LOC129283150 isoform X2 n=1 Tax=Lytechinus pictus TaxID=7653 RepID=UPI0030BA1ACF
MQIGRSNLTSYGPGISKEVAVMICSAPSLRDVHLIARFHHTFYETLAREGRKATVHTLEIWNDKPLSSASSHHLVEALCSLPNLTNLILRGVWVQEFCSHLNEKASTLKVHTLQIWDDEPLSSASSHHLVEALCSLPNLTNLILRGVYDQEELYSQLNEKASTLNVHTLQIRNVESLSSASSHHLVEALCSLPNLTNLILNGVCDKEEFYSHLNEKASTLKVHTLEIWNYKPLSSASSHHLVEALCSLPNLTNLILRGVCDQEEFCSHLKEKASTLKVHTLQIWNYKPLSSASSHHLVEALCFLPNLTNLILSRVWDQEEFYSLLNEKASTLKGSFPQISKGNFMFNRKPQKDLQSFLQTVSEEKRDIETSFESSSDEIETSSESSSDEYFDA